MPNSWRIGVNVPWTVSWTGEQSFDLRDSTEFPGLVDLVQAEHPGEGTPRFAAVHVTRQRAGMAQHLCHVCGRRTPSRDRYIFPKESGGFVTLGDDSLRYAGTVPPVHLACARRAQKLCPHLSHTYAEPVAFPSEESRVMPRPDVPEGMQEMARKLPRGMKIVYSYFRLYGPRFSEKVERMRRTSAGDTWAQMRQGGH